MASSTSYRCDVSETCKHQQKKKNFQSGDLSCLECGLVIVANDYDDEGTHSHKGGRLQVQPSRSLKLNRALKEIGIMAARINLVKNVEDGAQELFQLVHEGNQLKGLSHDEIAAGCLYISCRQQFSPRSFEAISAASYVGASKIANCSQNIMELLNIKLDPVYPADFVTQFCGSLGLPFPVEKAAMHVAKKAWEIGIVSSLSVISVAAASVYMASQASEEKFHKKKKQIEEIAYVTDATIRSCYQLMLPQVAELFPKDYVFTTPIELLPST